MAFSNLFGGRDLQSIIDQVSGDSPFKDGKEKMDSEQFQSKLVKLRSYQPKSVTSDVANIIGTLYNTKVYGRQTVQGYMGLLLDRMGEMSNYWALAIERSNGPKSAATTPNVSDEPIQELDWKDFDAVEKEDLVEQLAILQRDIQKYKEIIRISEGRCSDYDQIAQVKEQLADQLESLQNENKEMQMNIANEFASLRLERKMLQKELAITKAELDDLQSAKQSSSSGIQERLALLEGAVQAKDSLEVALAQLQFQMKALNEDNERLVKSKIGLEEEAHNLRCQNADLLRRLSEMSMSMEGSHKSEARFASVMQAKTAAENRAKELEESFQDFAQTKAALEELVDKKEKKVKKLGAHKEVLVRECVTLRADVASLKEAVADLHTEMDKISSRLAQKNNEVDALEVSEREMRKQLVTTKELAASLEQQLEHERAMSVLNNNAEEKAMLLEALESCKRKLAEKEDQLALTVRQLLDLQTDRQLEQANGGSLTPTPGSGINKLKQSMPFSFSALQMGLKAKGSSLYKGWGDASTSSDATDGTVTPPPQASATPATIVGYKSESEFERYRRMIRENKQGSDGDAQPAEPSGQPNRLSPIPQLLSKMMRPNGNKNSDPGSSSSSEDMYDEEEGGGHLNNEHITSGYREPYAQEQLLASDSADDNTLLIPEYSIE